jgi:diguanylate cyclase (GGDEF)-like protein
MEKLLEHLSVTDPMTGLYNRRGFFLLAQQQLRIAERINQSIVLFFFDLDDFKSVNDKFGHQEGDVALTKTAEMLRKTFRQSDILGRTGGDEFIALVIQNNPIDVESISTRLEENLKNLNSEINKEYRLSLSFGVAYFDPAKKQTIDNLIATADKMMYAQKRKKKKLRQQEDLDSQQDVAH